MSYHGRSILETGVTVDKDAISESKNDTDQEDQETPKHTQTSRHKAGCITSQSTGPGHFGGIQHRTDEGEGSGSDGLVPGGTLEQELNIVDGKNDETAKSEIEGIMVEKVIAGQGEVGLEATQLHHEDGEGPTEAEAPREHRPVNCARTPSVHAGHQQAGHSGGEQLPQVEEGAHGSPGAQA